MVVRSRQQKGPSAMFSPKKALAGAAGLAALGLGGAAVAGAATSTSPATTSTPATTPAQTAPAGHPPGNMPPPGAPGHGAMKPVTGTDATKAQTAAVKDAGGGTAGAVTTAC